MNFTGIELKQYRENKLAANEYTDVNHQTAFYVIGISC